MPHYYFRDALAATQQRVPAPPFDSSRLGAASRNKPVSPEEAQINAEAKAAFIRNVNAHCDYYESLHNASALEKIQTEIQESQQRNPSRKTKAVLKMVNQFLGKNTERNLNAAETLAALKKSRTEKALAAQ